MKALQVIAFFLFASLTCFSQSFSTKSYSIDGTAAQIIVADFNGDHIPDIGHGQYKRQYCFHPDQQR
jgi:hypothetical protein